MRNKHNKDYSYSAVLILPNGDFFPGYSFGAVDKLTGEACFSTSMTGYQEAVTDPSYNSQILVCTFPHIGNVGHNPDDYEREAIGVQGLVLREPIGIDSNYRSEGNFNTWLTSRNVVGICGVDTRAITKLLARDGHGNCMIAPYNQNTDVKRLYNELRSAKMLSEADLSRRVACKEPFDWLKGLWGIENAPRNNLKVAVIDFGAKYNALRHLYSLGCDVRVFPFYTSVSQIVRQYRPDGILLSNGPGNPAETFKVVKGDLEFLLESNIPVFGICFGHQLLALAAGARVYKMRKGHRSITHPVFDKIDNRLRITTQNHGFAVDPSSLASANIEVTHESLLDGCIEGIRLKGKKAFSVQFHPEGAPGPNDSMYLFDRFIAMMRDR